MHMEGFILAAAAVCVSLLLPAVRVHGRGEAALPRFAAAAPKGERSTALKHMEEDDSDIKIAGGPGEHKPAVDDLSDAMELQKQKDNGNLPRARALGTRLAEELAQTGAGNQADDPAKLAFTYAVYFMVEKQIGSKVLQQVVENVFYDVLKHSQPDFHLFLDETGSLSLYYLAVRRGGDVLETLADHLASMERQKDAEPCAALLSRYRDRVGRLIGAAGFKE